MRMKIRPQTATRRLPETAPHPRRRQARRPRLDANPARASIRALRHRQFHARAAPASGKYFDAFEIRPQSATSVAFSLAHLGMHHRQRSQDGSKPLAPSSRQRANLDSLLPASYAATQRIHPTDSAHHLPRAAPAPILSLTHPEARHGTTRRPRGPHHGRGPRHRCRHRAATRTGWGPCCPRRSRSCWS